MKIVSVQFRKVLSPQKLVLRKTCLKIFFLWKCNSKFIFKFRETFIEMKNEDQHVTSKVCKGKELDFINNAGIAVKTANFQNLL